MNLAIFVIKTIAVIFLSIFALLILFLLVPVWYLQLKIFLAEYFCRDNKP